MNSPGPICIVDDEPAICETLAVVLMDEGYSVTTCPTAEAFAQVLAQQQPALVLLDIWLPGTDGMAVLSRLRETHPDLPVIMMSGHAGIESAVNAIKLGARDFLEKPLHLEVILDKIARILSLDRGSGIEEFPSDTGMEVASIINRVIPENSMSLAPSSRPQRTLKENVVLNGTGLLSGRNTGIILSPMEPDAGIVFQTLDGTTVPGTITHLENFNHSVATQTFTANSTVLALNNRRIRTVEHLMSALSMEGITNVRIKVDEEVPNVDGSATDFCRLIQHAGIVDQDVPAEMAVVRKRIQVGIEDPDEKHLFMDGSGVVDAHLHRRGRSTPSRILI